MKLCQLFIDFKIAYDVLYNILIQFAIPMKLVRLIKMCVNETCRRDRVGKPLSKLFPIRNGLKQRDNQLPLLFNFAIDYAIRSSGNPGWLEIKCYTSVSGLC
jgi:hypothetical protein